MSGLRSSATTGMRWTVARKLAALGLLGVGVSAVIGGISFIDSGQVKAVSSLRTALVQADTAMAELDRLCSEDQVAERDMLLATTDPARKAAYDEAAANRTLADAQWTTLDRIPGLPADVHAALTTLQGRYADFLNDVDAQQKILAPINP